MGLYKDAVFVRRAKRALCAADERMAQIIKKVGPFKPGVVENAFQAFLDNIAELSGPGSGTTFLLLGRTQTLEDSWLYLTESGVSTALITISPFSLVKAKTYIDAFTDGMEGAYATQYSQVRDTILAKLGNAFSSDSNTNDDDFLSFIGYPPVLDAIATLLREETNYFKLHNVLEGDEHGENIEVSLLHGIAEFILRREREDKVL
ncbi:MAG: hypothetical protein IIB58_02300, partial [Planctomycetes bacterium]|nr:hypothetical protein [Planctomycetota bacterium]